MRRRPLSLLTQLGPVAIGLGVLGLASFAFLSVSGRALGPAEIAPLVTLWVLINAIGPALFFPLEQEVGRAVAARAAVGAGARPVVLRATTLAGGLVVLVVLGLALGAGPLADAVFGGHQLMVLALGCGVVGLAAEHLTRGAFAGVGHFGRYGTQLAVDGALRIGSAAVLAVLGVAVAGPYGLLLGVSPLVAVAVTAGRLSGALSPGPTESWRQLGRAIGWLTVGSLASQFVVNAAPVAAGLLAGAAEQARAGVFSSALVLARIPLFLFAAIQAFFLPGLAALAAVEDTVGFRRRVTSIAVLVSALGAAGLAVLIAIGPWLVRLVYGPDFVITRADLWPLGAASALFMLAQVLSQSLVSVRAYRGSALGWGVGAVLFFGFLALPLRLEERVGGAFLAGCLAATIVLALVLRRRLQRPLNTPAPPDPILDPCPEEATEWT